MMQQQYITEGFYPTGAKVASDGFTPMGALIKAIMINSGDALTGKHGSSRNLGPAPSYLQGHGAINLSNTLKTNAAGVNTYLDGDFADMPTLDQGQMIEYKVTVEASSTDLKVTLVYHDAPAAVQASVALVNDLDLVVIAASGATTYPNSKSTFDRRNNVEQVVLSNLAAGVYTVRINGHAVPEGPQPYALVVTGGASVVKGETGDPAPTAKPIPAPTREPVVGPPVCKDVPEGWYDSDGPTYDCEWYSVGSRCRQYGNGYENNGATANKACCACGGGSLPSGTTTGRESEVQAKTGADAPTAKTAAKSDSTMNIVSAAGAGLGVGALAAVAIVVGMKKSAAGRTAEVGFGSEEPATSKRIESGNPSFQDL
jgi:hypothetical protein